MSLLSKTFVGSLLVVAAVGSRAHAGVALATSQQSANASLAEIGKPTGSDVPSAYAFENAPIDLSMPQRVIDLPALKPPLPISDSPNHLRDRPNAPAVEPVPAPNAMALGLVMLGMVAFGRIVRRFKLA
jgi:hypothetical protein